MPPVAGTKGCTQGCSVGKERMVVGWGAVEEIVGSKGVIWVGKMHA